MSIKNLCVYAGLCAGIASMAAGQSQNQTLQQIDAGIKVEPIQIAKVVMENGKVVFQSDWMEYTGDTSREYVTRVFDCFGDADSDGFMDDAYCGSGTSRWYFGTGFSNLFVTNDMTPVCTVVKEAGFGRADFAWYWTCDGASSETCVIALFTQDSQPCDADSGDYSGWLMDFGTLGCNPGGYYYTNVDLGSDTWACPAGGVGSYTLIYGQEVTTSGAFVMATLAQPMLWGTGDDIPGYTDEIIGTQDVNQFDELVPVDLVHTSSECFTYSFTSICPNVIGAMMQFWGAVGGVSCDCYADFNGDGEVNSLDFLVYLGDWAAGDPSADCNEDGIVNSQDFLCFLGLWAAGC